MNKSCSGVEELYGYLEGGLSGEDRVILEDHISGCETCLQEIIISNGLIRGMEDIHTDPVSESVTQSAVDLVNNRYVKSSVPILEMVRNILGSILEKVLGLFNRLSWGNLEFETVRGSKSVVFENIIRFKKNFKDLKAEIEIERIGVQDVNILVAISNHQPRKDGIRITLFREQRELSSLLIDTAGYVIFEKMPFGHYGLVVAKDGMVLGDYYFNIAGSHYGKKRN